METTRQQTKRQLIDLARILEQLHLENWEDEREVLLRALATHAPVLRKIAVLVEHSF